MALPSPPPKNPPPVALPSPPPKNPPPVALPSPPPKLSTCSSSRDSSSSGRRSAKLIAFRVSIMRLSPFL
ncbi:MAG: hypothetical protein DMG65_06930 [Candidatus Angelobacter sp. Gp1-AA117]|nr:MAG: hypothetical protein DMG65_06930 [Candidatus Angelobacter sp. Gp1-AA117]